MHCSDCGSEIIPGSKFCVNCGKPVVESVIPAASRPHAMHVVGKICLSRPFLYTICAILLVILATGTAVIINDYSKQEYLQSQVDAFSTSVDEKVVLLTEAGKNLDVANKQYEDCSASNTALLSGKTAAEADAAAQLSEAQKQKGIASQNASEAQKQKNIAAQKAAEAEKSSQGLSACQYYLNLAAELADLLDTQKKYYKAANGATIKATLDILNSNYYSAQQNLSDSKYYYNLAESYEPQVNALLGQFR